MSRPMKTLLAGAAGVSLVIADAMVKSAEAQQDPNPNVPVSQRFKPDYSPKGMPAGAFRLFPTLRVVGSYDDNVNAEDSNEDDDFVLNIRPEIRAVSEFSRHRLTLGAGADVGFYQDQDENDYQDAFVSANGLLEVRRGSEITGNLRLARDHEGRDSADDGGNENDITKIDRLDAGLAFRQNFNRIFGQIGSDFRRLDYRAGRNSDRDRNELQPFLRVGYDISPRVDTYVEGRGRFVRYDRTPDDNGEDRDSDGFITGVGADIDFTGTLFGNVFAGYEFTEYDDNDLDDANGFNGGAQLTWNVTGLTSLIADVRSGVRETTVNFDGDSASANIQFVSALRIEHELRRNIILNGSVGYQRDDFEGTSRTDDTLRAGVGASYLLNRNFSVDLNYNISDRSSDDNDEEFTRNVILLGATARF